MYQLLNLDEKKQIALRNTNLILAMWESQNIDNDGELIIKLFSTHTNLHSAIRERFVRKDFFLHLEKAIKEKMRLKYYTKI